MVTQVSNYRWVDTIEPVNDRERHAAGALIKQQDKLMEIERDVAHKIVNRILDHNGIAANEFKLSDNQPPHWHDEDPYYTPGKVVLKIPAMQDIFASLLLQ